MPPSTPKKTRSKLALQVEAGTPPKVAFVIRGWRWYPPEREARYLLRLTAFCTEPASL